MVRRPPKLRAMRKRRMRKIKMRKLRAKYLQARTEAEKKAIIEKALRVNPFITKEQFLQPIKSLKK
ncbi:hypothetical protein J7K70_00250 [bacterium]|nr:hypothetical protein [bacterium]